MKPYLTSLVGAHIFLVRDQKVFLIRRFNTGFRDGHYSVPAGHVDDGETVIEAAVREAREEVGVTISLEDLAFVHVVHIRKLDPEHHDQMQFFFVAEKWVGEPENREPTHCDHADWYPLESLPENVVLYVAQALSLYPKRNFFSFLDE